MTDDRLRNLYRRSLAGRGSQRRADCPSPEQLVALVERQGPETERLATLDHVMACAACHQEFELLRTLAAAAPGGPRRTLLVPLALAASLALVLGGALLWRVLTPVPDDVYRGAPASLTLISPAGTVSGQDARVFTWRPVPQARSYIVEIFTSDGALAFSDQSADTSLGLPESVELESGSRYRWWVRAVLESGLEERSPTVEFTLR